MARSLFLKNRLTWSKSRSTGEVIIVGNGPSLKQDIYSIKKNKTNTKVCCLNYFASTDYFYSLKPEIYVMADAMFWRDDVNLSVSLDNNALFSILGQVDWNMKIVCPMSGFKKISKKFINNDNIKVVGVSSNGTDLRNDYLNLFALNYGIATPVFNNVMILALWYSMKLGSDNIKIYGADFSFFKEYSVDQNTNMLISKFSHFYKNTEAQSKAGSKYLNNSSKMMHTRLSQAQNAFYQMYLLSKVAKSKNINIFNCSSHSYLDCFDRCN